MADDRIALAMDGLGFFYRPGQWVIRGYTVALRRGAVLAILGPNGCGKSTLLKLVLGLIRPKEGRLSIHGRIAFVPQLFDVVFDYSVLDNRPCQ